MLRKFGNLSTREILVVTITYAVGPYILSGGGTPESAGLGMEYVIFSWLEIVRCICATRVFLGGKSRKKSGEFKMYASSGNLLTDS